MNKIQRNIGAVLAILLVVVGLATCSNMLVDLHAPDPAGVALSADKDALTTDSFAFTGTNTATNVTDTFTVPVTGTKGSTIGYTVSPEGVVTVAADGTVTVTRPAGTTVVTLTATLTKDGSTVTKTLTVTVIGTSDESIATADQAALTTDSFTYASGESGSTIGGTFTVPVIGVNGSTLTYTASPAGILTIAGGGTVTVTRPATTTPVTLTATITKGTTILTKTLTVTVLVGSGGGGTSRVGVVTTIAGSTTSGHADGTGTAATFNQPYGIATDGTNLYVADTQNYMIRKIVISTGVVSTLAGSGSNDYADGTGTAAKFGFISGMAIVGTDLYVADIGYSTIRKIALGSGVVTTFAGSAGNTGSADGDGTAATFNHPSGLATDGSNLYVADTNNHLIRKIVIGTGAVSTLAGTGSEGSANGTGTVASFYYPNHLAVVGDNLYVVDSSNNLIRKIVISTEVVTTLAGSGSQGAADGTGTAASFNAPYGIASDGTNLYIGDGQNNMIRQVVISSGEVTTLAGSTASGHADGTGSAASFFIPTGIATTDGTTLYVADTYNNMIRKIQ